MVAVADETGPTDPDQLLELVGTDPERALAAADSVVGSHPRPRSPQDVRLVVAAQRTAGLALRGLGRPAEGEARVRQGLALAERTGQAEVAAEARMTLAFLLLELGRTRAALTATDHALAVLRGPRAARVRATRALVLQRAGRPREAFAEYDAALTVLRRHGDKDWEARLLHNRALLSIEFGETRAAIADLERSRAYSLGQGHLVDATDALHNIGIATEVAGDVPAALAIFDQVETEWAAAAVDRPQLWFGRVDAYLSVGLVADATDNARTAVQWLTDRQWEGLEAQARYTLAKCLLAAPGSDLTEAREHAALASSMFVVQERRESQALADYVLLTCNLRDATTAKDLDGAIRVAERLRETGCDAEAADLRSTAGRAALEVGDLRRAKVLLGPLIALDRARTLDVRTRAWFARALVARADGDLADAQRSLRHAWQVVESQRALLGATELRAAAATHATAMVETGAQLAVASRSATEAFSWAERGRAALLRYRPVMAPSDPELARALARLRWAARTDDDARLDGEPDRAASAARRSGEAEVVRLSRRSSAPQERTAPVTARDVRAQLGDDAFVQYFALDGALFAVCLAGRATRLVELGPSAPVEEALGTVLFGLRRLLTGFGTAGGRERGGMAVRSAAAVLDQRLLVPLLGVLGDRRLVVCPNAGLTSVPWPLLATARGRELRVAPSATVWCRSRGATASADRGVLAVAGPGLAGAEAEARAVAAIAGARLLVGRDATVANVLAEAEQVATLHLAAHGRLRTDNPLFSAVELVDGPVTGYDLEGLAHVPETVLLSACSSGAGHATVAEETLGLAWTLMGAGSSTVVAPLLPVPDAATTELMVDVHRRMAGGSSPAAALSAAQAGDDGDPEAAAVAAVFVAYGA